MGFINNTYDYRKSVFNPRFGNFGLFTLPMSVLSYFVIVTVFFISWYKMLTFFIDKIIIMRLVGLNQFSFHLDSFFISAKALVFIGAGLFLLFITFIWLGHRISNVKRINPVNTVTFFALYSFLVPFWVLRSIYNSLASARPSWR